jgi:predicted transcriptional regulator YdeE
MKKQTMEFSSGFIVPETAPAAPAGMTDWSVPATNALCIEHTGRYEHLGNAWSAGHQILRARKLKQSNLSPFEVYRNKPNETASSDLRTDIYLPLR